MQELIHSDYRRFLFDISLRQVQFMRNEPGKAFFVVFDYTTLGDVEVTVMLQSKLKEFGDYPHLEVELPIQRAQRARGGGKMRLHIMALGEGRWVKLRLFPLRASSGEFQTGLRGIAKASKLESESWAEHDERAIRALLLKTRGNLIEVH
ncbi:hypothetical protein B0H16DRAFT_1535444 [Mycena metata]|uniref:Uncharacterized protein n=1 Tax=Mycena metata TaxID=1033252 RepID=A0AAD7NG26_9AGAR|nr:hypothetical protein B0H16DRAFT_1535444 [Mycena metata]